MRGGGSIDGQRGRWRHAGRLLGSFWTSPDWRFAWGAGALLIATELASVYVLVWQNDWQRRLFDAIEQRDAAVFVDLLFVFALILATQIAVILFGSWLRQLFGLRWRVHLTERYVGRWLADDRFARIEREGTIDNPDQRIADDLRFIAAGVTTLGLGLVSALAGTISFAVVLWQVAVPAALPIEQAGWNVPGNVVWYAFGYALLGSLAMVWIGRPFVRRSQAQQRHEADFRADLIHVRRDSRDVVAAGTIALEAETIGRTFGGVQANFRRLIVASLGLTAGRGIYERIGAFLPLVLFAPAYFAGGMSFGGLMSARDAFQRLTGNLSYFVQVYPRIAEQIANINRVRGLDAGIEAAPAAIARVNGPADRRAMLHVRNLRIADDDGAELLALRDWTVGRGERWQLDCAHPGGGGALLRLIAGGSAPASGTIALAQGETVALIAPGSHQPRTTLAAIVRHGLHPAPGDDDLRRLLDDAGLARLVPLLAQRRDWRHVLSPDEHLRLAVLRGLARRPTLILLDGVARDLAAMARAFPAMRIDQALASATVIATGPVGDRDDAIRILRC